MWKHVTVIKETLFQIYKDFNIKNTKNKYLRKYLIKKDTQIAYMYMKGYPTLLPLGKCKLKQHWDTVTQPMSKIWSG